MTNKLENISLNDSLQYQIDQHQGRSTNGDSTADMYVAVYNIALFAVTAPGNGLLLLALCADPLKCFRTPSSFLVISMTFANLVIGTVVEPLTVALSFAEHYKVVTPPIVFDFYKAFLCTTPNVSLFTLFALSLDSYIAASWPLKYKYVVTRKSVLSCTAVIWIYTTTFSLVQLSGIQEETYLKLDLYLNTTVTFVLLLASYVGLMKSLQANRKRALTLHPSQSSCQVSWSRRLNEERSRRSLNVVFILIIILTLTIIPNMISWMMFLNCHACKGASGFAVTRVILRYIAYLKFAIDPFVYAWRMPRYRRALKMAATCQLC